MKALSKHRNLATTDVSVAFVSMRNCYPPDLKEEPDQNQPALRRFFVPGSFRTDFQNLEEERTGPAEV